MISSVRGYRIGILTVLALSGPAAAQDSAVEHCRQAATDAARIACLEAALAEPSTDATAPEDAEAPSPAEVAARDAEIDSDTGISPGPAAASDDDGIGARQVRSRNQTSAEIEASLESATGLRVAKYSEVPYRRLQIELENGQIWQQIVGDTQRVRVDLNRNQTVDINESRISGYKLRLNELQRTIRVERIR